MAKPGAPPQEAVFDAATARGARLPWWLKICLKLLLFRLLPSYRWRRRLKIGVHSHYAGALGNRDAILRDLARFRTLAGRPVDSLLELGPGDTVANALYAAAAGVASIWLMDTGDFAATDMAVYRGVLEAIQPANPGFVARVDLSSREAMLASIGARYLPGGPAALSAIPDRSIDLVVSYAVLEHVRRAAFPALLAEHARLLAPGGVGLHWVDLMDHLGGRLNNLRFGPLLWEHDAVARSGFYTNRLRCADMCAAAAAVGLEASVPWVARWPALPTPRRAMDARFAAYDDAELRIARFELILRAT